MTKVVFIEPSGNEVEIDAQDGWSIMQIGTANNVDGLVGECGGSCACATCHCYVESKEELLPNADENELSMLDYAAAETRANSRLSCQIKVTPELEGIRIKLPAEQ